MHLIVGFFLVFTDLLCEKCDIFNSKWHQAKMMKQKMRSIKSTREEMKKKLMKKNRKLKLPANYYKKQNKIFCPRKFDYT